MREGDYTVGLPCAYYLFKKDDGYIKEFLTPAAELTTPEGLSMTINEIDGDAVNVTIKNDGEEEWDYGEHFSLQILLDSVWYNIPVLGELAFEDIGYTLMPGEEQNHTYYLSKYGDFPAGDYRIVVMRINSSVCATFHLYEKSKSSSVTHYDNIPEK